jgi:integrase
MALTDTFVKNVKWKGSVAGERHSDALGLYLRVKEAGKYWRCDYRVDGKPKTLSLGVYPAVTLAKARKGRDAARELLAEGKDPGVIQRAEKHARVEAAKNDFAGVAEAWLVKTNYKRMQVTTGKLKTWLANDINPYIGKLPISTITPRDVLERVLRRMEKRDALDSAARVKTLISQIFRYAVASGLTERDVTVDLKGALTTRKKTHHAAITDPKTFGGLLRALHGHAGHPTVRAALRLAPLVFVRPSELRLAEWTEIDLDAAVWTVPAIRTKMKRDLIVPLAAQAVEILREQQKFAWHGQYVFPSIRAGGLPMSDGTMNAALQALGYAADIHVPHGFRASARSMLDEHLGERPDLIEAQLGHTVHGPLGRTYQRATFLDQRVAMMQRWADYLDGLRVGGNVVQLKEAA